MKRRRLILIVGLLAVIVMTAAFAVAASADKGKHRKADGEWCYLPLEVPEPEDFVFAYAMGDNAFLTGSYDSTWTGTFTGSSNDNALVIWHEAPTGPAVFVDLISFDSVEVDGKSGGLEIYLYGEGVVGDWAGSWFIASASGELVGLEGHGEWWGPGYQGEGCGVTSYSVAKLKGVDFDDDDDGDHD